MWIKLKPIINWKIWYIFEFEDCNNDDHIINIDKNI